MLNSVTATRIGLSRELNFVWRVVARTMPGDGSGLCIAHTNGAGVLPWLEGVPRDLAARELVDRLSASLHEVVLTLVEHLSSSEGLDAPVCPAEDLGEDYLLILTSYPDGDMLVFGPAAAGMSQRVGVGCATTALLRVLEKTNRDLTVVAAGTVEVEGLD